MAQHVDRNQNTVVEFEVTTSREFSSYFPMALRLDLNYKIEIACSDYYDVYGKYKISKALYDKSRDCLSRIV